MSFLAVGKSWSPADFTAWVQSGCRYQSTIKLPTRPFAGCAGVCLHHTAEPSLAQRPDGFLQNHMRNLRDYYRDTLSWSAGPHFFIDDRRVSALTPISERGVHAGTLNGKTIGIEVLGDYDRETPHTGRGLTCWQNAAAATAALLQFLKLTPSTRTVFFHRDDPRTSKSCPGSRITKEWVLSLINQAFKLP